MIWVKTTEQEEGINSITLTYRNNLCIDFQHKSENHWLLIFPFHCHRYYWRHIFTVLTAPTFGGHISVVTVLVSSALLALSLPSLSVIRNQVILIRDQNGIPIMKQTPDYNVHGRRREGRFYDVYILMPFTWYSYWVTLLVSLKRNRKWADNSAVVCGCPKRHVFSYDSRWPVMMMLMMLPTQATYRYIEAAVSGLLHAASLSRYKWKQLKPPEMCPLNAFSIGNDRFVCFTRLSRFETDRKNHWSAWTAIV